MSQSQTARSSFASHLLSKMKKSQAFTMVVGLSHEAPVGARHVTVSQTVRFSY